MGGGKGGKQGKGGENWSSANDGWNSSSNQHDGWNTGGKGSGDAWGEWNNNNDWKGGKNNDWNGGGQGGGKGGYGGTTFGGVQGGSSSYGGGGQGGGFGFGGNYDGSGFGTAQSMYGGMGGGMKGGMMGGVANTGECYNVRVYGWCGKQVCQWKHKPGSHFPGETFSDKTQKYLATVIAANKMMEDAGNGGGGGGNDWQNQGWGGGKGAYNWNGDWDEGDWKTNNKKKKPEKKKKKKTPVNAKGKGKGKGKKGDEEHEMEDEEGDLTGTFEACEDLAAYVGYATKLCLEQSKTDEFTETSHVLDEGRAEWFERMACWFADGTKKGPKKLLALMEPDIIEVFKNNAGLDFGIDKCMQEIVGNLAKFNNPAEAGKKVCKLVGARTTCVEADLPRLIVMLTYMEMRYNGPLAWEEDFDAEEDTEEEEEEEEYEEEEEEDDL